MREIVQRYAVDGVHLDYVRYPTDQFDYSRDTLAAFRRSILPDLGDADRGPLRDTCRKPNRCSTRARFPNAWRAFRIDHLTNLLTQLRETVRAARPGAVVSAAVVPDPMEAAGRGCRTGQDGSRKA